MGFADGYTPQRSMTLPNGEYECIIRSAEMKVGNFGKYIEVTVQARGKKGWSPNKLLYSERPQIGQYKNNGNPITEEDQKKWDKKLTNFFDAFGITPGNWVLESWVNKVGWCKVAEQYDKNEPDFKSKKFKELFPFVKVFEENIPGPLPSQAPITPQEEEKIPF